MERFRVYTRPAGAPESRSPPAASRPFGSVSALSGGGNASARIRRRQPAQRAHGGAESSRINCCADASSRVASDRERARRGRPCRRPRAESRGQGRRRSPRGSHGREKPMARPGRLRHEAAADLVLALRAGLESPQPLADAVLDALVVARLEMQAVEVGAAAPVAAIQASCCCESRSPLRSARPGGARGRSAGSRASSSRSQRRTRGSGRARGRGAERVRVEIEDRVPIAARRLVAAAGARRRCRLLPRAGARVCAFLRFRALKRPRNSSKSA